MHRTKKRQERIIRLIDELKNNSYPNAETFARKLRNLDIDANIDITATAKTIKRDIAYLRSSYNAPIKYCPLNHGYYLEYAWSLPLTEVSQEELFATLFSSRISEKQLPSFLNSLMISATRKHIAVVDTDEISFAYLNTIIMATHFDFKVSSEVLKTVLDAWKNNRLLNIIHFHPENKKTDDVIVEPHGFFSFENIWYLKSYSKSDEVVKNYALHRIQNCRKLPDTFHKRREIIEFLQNEQSINLFGYPSVKNVRCRCNPKDAGWLMERKWYPDMTFEIYRGDDNNEYVDLIFPQVPREDFIGWILRNAGCVEVLKPKNLRKEVRERAKGLFEAHS